MASAAEYLALSPAARAVVRDAAAGDPPLSTPQAVVAATLLGAVA